MLLEKRFPREQNDSIKKCTCKCMCMRHNSMHEWRTYVHTAYICNYICMCIICMHRDTLKTHLTNLIFSSSVSVFPNFIFSSRVRDLGFPFECVLTCWSYMYISLLTRSCYYVVVDCITHCAHISTEQAASRLNDAIIKIVFKL